MAATTRFTIAIPTHDRRETAVLAVRSALAQTRAPAQILVLCDGCGDGTAGAVRELGSDVVEAIELPKAEGYAYRHRNRSLELASGEAILWLGDDDLLMPDHLERIGEIWDTGRFDLVQSDGVVILPDDSLEHFGDDWSLPEPRELLSQRNSNPMASVSIGVQLARSAGGWDASLPRAADWDLWRRAIAAGARCARSLEPTVLHFRATRRVQPWRDRVRQNTAWLVRLEDPLTLAETRIDLRRAAGARVAQVEGLAAERAREADALRRRVAELEQIAADPERRIAAAEARAEELAATLTGIYASGWWRLRARLQPLLRLLSRAREVAKLGRQ